MNKSNQKTCRSDSGTSGTLRGTLKSAERTRFKPIESTVPDDWYVWYVQNTYTHTYRNSLNNKHIKGAHARNGMLKQRTRRTKRTNVNKINAYRSRFLVRS